MIVLRTPKEKKLVEAVKKTLLNAVKKERERYELGISNEYFRLEEIANEMLYPLGIDITKLYNKKE